MDVRFAGFVLVSALLIITPGPDMALVTSNALRGGRRAAAAAAAFRVLKLAGGAYLVYLGLKSLCSGIAGTQVPTSSPRHGFSDRPFLQGLLGNLLNPKAAVVFLTVLPQFIRPGDSVFRLLTMLAIFEAMLIGWLHLYGFAIARAGQAFGTSGLRRWLSSLTGAILVGLGVRLAFERS
jgi:threonine/homoserine/homoserine lactone efflux protein